MKLTIYTSRHAHWRKTQKMIADLIEDGTHTIEERDAGEAKRISCAPSIMFANLGIVALRNPDNITAEHVLSIDTQKMETKLAAIAQAEVAKEAEKKALMDKVEAVKDDDLKSILLELMRRTS